MSEPRVITLQPRVPTPTLELFVRACDLRKYPARARVVEMELAARRRAEILEFQARRRAA